MAVGTTGMLGSSPRVWGTHGTGEKEESQKRFIPTGVGNASVMMGDVIVYSGSSPRVWGTQRWHSRNSPCNSVHPHGCGERVKSLTGKAITVGSSPRVWGTLLGAGPDMTIERFIPTGVGNALPGHVK